MTIERHPCLKKLATSLAKQNTQLGYAFSIPKMEARLIVATEKIDKKNRTMPVRVVATFCPFCGKKL